MRVMRGRDRDDRVVIFERTARRLGLSGKRRAVAWHYFIGTPLKHICVVLKMPEGTLKSTLNRLHGIFRTTNRPEFVHAIYANGAHRRHAAGGPDFAPPP